MTSIKVLLVAPILATFATSAFAQGTQQTTSGRTQQGYTQGNASGVRTPAATQPSNNPFQNPIGQGVPPAVSSNPALNSNRTSAPR